MSNVVKKGQSPRETALIIMYQVDQKGAYANLELNKVLNRDSFTGQDRAFITELVYGCTRMQGTIDYILGLFIKKPLGNIPPWVLWILRLGVYQIMYLDKVPDRAAVNESVNLTKKYGHAGTVKFVNGVLRNISREKENIVFPSLEEDPVEHISVVYSHPKWLIRRWLDQLGQEATINLCQADNLSPQVTVRTNTLRISRDLLAERLAQEGVRVSPGRYVPESIILEGVHALASLPSFQEGLFQVQDESSMMVAHALGAEPGSKVVDCCAAPGGKTTHIAQLMENRGVIKALDIYSHKLMLVDENCKRLGIDIVEICEGDAANLPSSLSDWADWVLVDAPCSGLGVLRRRTDSRWKKEESLIKELADLQKKIISAAAKTLVPGGVMVYSTCTISPEENESVIKWFLENNKDFLLDPIASFHSLGLGDRDRAQADTGMIQLLPHVHGTDGLFIARMRKGERGK